MLKTLTHRTATLALVLTPTLALCTAAAPMPASPMQEHGPATCVTAIEISGINNLRNDCGHTVEIFWCTIGPDCDNDHGSTWSLGKDKVWAVGENVRWGACHGADSGGFDRGTSGTHYSCE